MKPCPCGSGLARRDLRDARGIFAGFVCDRCEAEKRQAFRPEVFEDPQYETVEDVEGDDCSPQDWG